MDLIKRWRAYQQEMADFNAIHGPGANPWLVNPDRAERRCDLFAALPLWLRVADILCATRGRCWRDAVYEVRHARCCHSTAWADLTAWDEAHAEAASGVWRLSSPCGYENWKLYAPGVGVLDDSGFISNAPTALHPAIGEAADPSAHGDPPLSLEQLRDWAVPWIEKVSGQRVVAFVEGWGAPYGPDQNMQEWAAFAHVQPGGDR